MALRTSNVRASLDNKIEVLNGSADEASAVNQVFRTAGNVLALIRVRTTLCSCLIRELWISSAIPKGQAN